MNDIRRTIRIECSECHMPWNEGHRCTAWWVKNRKVMCTCGHLCERHDPEDGNCESGPPCACKQFDARDSCSVNDIQECPCGLPPPLKEAINTWLTANNKTPYEVRYAAFPIGMVNGWIERAKSAEQTLNNDKAIPTIILEEKIVLEEMTPEEAEQRTTSGQISIGDILLWMKQHGQSIILNWGEDDNLWECSWITRGQRFTGHNASIRSAIATSLAKRLAVMGAIK